MLPEKQPFDIDREQHCASHTHRRAVVMTAMPQLHHWIVSKRAMRAVNQSVKNDKMLHNKTEQSVRLMALSSLLRIAATKD